MKGVHVLFAGIAVVAVLQVVVHTALHPVKQERVSEQDEAALLDAVRDLQRRLNKANTRLRRLEATAGQGQGAGAGSSGGAEGGSGSGGDDDEAGGEALRKHDVPLPRKPGPKRHGSAGHSKRHASGSDEGEAGGGGGNTEGGIDLAKVDAQWTLPAGKAAAVSEAVALKVHDIKAGLELDDSCTKSKDFQSSRAFHDFHAPKEGGWGVPGAAAFDGDAQCDPANYSPSEEERRRCEAFIADMRNWKHLRPMSSVLSKARTIKFIVQSTDPKVKFILKIPQHKFVVEPYSEYAAYEADKILGTNRVPTTRWVSVPVSWLRASMSLLMPAMYVQWVECFVFNHKDIKDLVKPWGDDGVDSINLSAQLWMAGVHELHSTSLVMHTHTVQALLNPEGDKVPKKTIEKWAVQETSDLYVFDHIIGNSDRTLTKNAFAVGDCSQEPWDCSSLTDKRHLPRMVFLDQGSSFYSQGASKTSVFRHEDSTICKFRLHTFSSVTTFDKKGDFAARMKELLPESQRFWKGFKAWQIEGADRRIRSLARHMLNCKSKFGDRVFLDK